MKKAIFFLALIVLAGCVGEPQYLLTGSLEGVDEADTILLRKRQGGEWVDLDSVTTVSGDFSFKGVVEYPQMVYLMVKGQRSLLTFFLENSKIQIKGHVDSLSVATVEGSVNQDEYVQFNDNLADFSAQNRELYQKYRKAKAAKDEETASALEQKMNQLYDKQQAFQKEYVKNHPASFVSPEILRQLQYGMDANELEEALARLDSSLMKVSAVKELQAHAQKLKLVSVGVVAPDFTQNDPDGNPVKLSDFRGKIVLVDFWASWCGPCRRENPNVVAVYNDYKDKGFDVLGVSLDRSKEDWLKAIDDDHLDWTQVSDLKAWKNEVAQQYAVMSIPTSFLLDRDGVIVAKSLRGEALRAKVAELLDK